MKRFFKKLGKLVGYALLYVVITLGTAIGILFLPTSAPSVKPEDTQVAVVAPQISKIYNNISSKKAMRLNLDLVTKGKSNLALNLDADIKTDDKNDKLQLQGNIELKVNDESLPISFCFKGGNLYLEMCNSKFTFNTNDIAKSLDQILSSLGFSLSSVGLDMQNLNLESLLGMLSDLKETVGKDIIILDVNVPVIGSIQIICDLNYNIKSLSMPQTTIDGTTIEFSTNLSYPQSVEIEKPQEEYMDISSMFEVVSSTLNYLTNDKIGLGLEFNKDNLNFTGNLYADLKDLTAKYEMDILGQNAKLFAIDKVLYFELGNLNLKFDMDSLPDALQIFNTHFNLDLPINFIKEVLSTPKEEFLNLNFSQLFTGDKNSTLSDLDLSIIENFTQNGNISSLKLKDIGQIDFEVENGNFKNLSFESNNITFKANSMPSKDISLTSDLNSYLDLAQTLPAIEAAISTTEEDNILADGTISIAGASGNIALKGNLSNSRINLNMSAFGKEISLDYFDNNAFLSFDDNYLRGSKEEIASLLEKLGIDLDPSSIIDTLKNWLDPQKNESSVKNIESGKNYLKITLFDEKTITLYYDSKITKIEIGIGLTQVCLNLTYPQNQITFSPIDESKYSSASIILNKIANAYEYIKNKTYHLEISGNTVQNTIQGIVNYYNGNLEASVEISGDNNCLNLIIKDQTIYLNVNNDFISCPLNDLNDAIKILKNFANLDLTNLAYKVDLNHIIENFLQSTLFKIEQNNILFTFKDLMLNLGFENENLNSLQIEGADFNGMISVKDAEQTLPQVDKAKYTQISSLIEKVHALNEYINGSEHYLTIKAQYKDFVLNGILNHQNEKLSARLQLRCNDTVASVQVQNKVLYIDYKDLHISCQPSTLKELTGLLDEKLGANLTSLIDKVISSVKFDSTLLDKVLSNSKFDFNDDNLTFGFDNLLVEIDFKDNMLANANVKYFDANIALNINSTPTILESVNEEDYLPLDNLLGKIKSILSFAQNKQLYLNFNAKYSSLELNGYLNLDEEGISLVAGTQIDGEKLEIKLIDKVIYIEKNNLKLKFALDQIENVKQFLTDEFNIDLLALLNIDFNNFSLSNIFEKANLKFENNSLEFEFENLIGKINFNEDDLAGLNLNYNDLTVEGNITSSKKEVTAQGKYTNIEELLPFVAAVKNYISSKQYNITASANVYEKNSQIYSAQNMLLQLDLTGKLKFYANAFVSGIKNTKTEGFNLNLNACGDQKNVYVNYNNLALKMAEGDFEKIIEMALNILNIDKGVVSTAKDFLNGEIALDDIMGLLSKNSSGLSLSAINLFKQIEVENNTLKIVIDGSGISTNAKAAQMEILLFTNSGKLSQISLKNFYTGVTDNEHFDLDLYLNDFNGVTAPDQSQRYIDLSGASDLIEAILNTATSYKTFDISGSINIKLKVGLVDIDWNIPVNLQINVVNGKIEMQAYVGVIPMLDLLVYNLNNDTPWENKLFKPLSVKNRMLYIYYKDNYFYFYRHETNNNGQSYEKALKADVQSVLDDILYYVKWGTGFNDDVINAIRKSIERSKYHTPNLGNIINSFTCPTQNKTDFYILNLSLKELTGDDKMGDLAIGASVKNVNGQNIISGLSLDMDMPLIWGTTLYIKSNSLNLTSGARIDMTTFNKFISGFAKGKESVEYSAENGQWKNNGDRTFTVKFETGFDDITLKDISGSTNSTFTLPKLADKVVGKKNAGDFTIYSFAGWFTSENFAKGSEFKDDVIPAKNITLYAKWDIKEGYRTINYYLDNTLLSSEYALIGSQLYEPDKFIEREQNNILYKQEFVAWKDKNGVAVEVVPDESQNLYASYQTYKTLNKFALSVVQGVSGQTLNLQVFETLSLKDYLPDYQQIQINKDGKTSIYLFKGWFTDSDLSSPAPATMPAYDLTIYAKWEFVKTLNQYAFTIHDNEKVYSYCFAPNMPIILSKDIPIYNNTLWYSDSNYLVPAYRPTLMPEHDVTLYIRNKYNVSYTYYVLENGKFTAKTYTKDLYQGATFTLQRLVNFEEVVKVENVPSKLVSYYFNGYKTAEGQIVNSNIVPNHNLTFSASYKTSTKSYYKLSFNSNWVEPAWWIKSNSETSNIRTLNDMYVLEGSYVIGTTLYKVINGKGNIEKETIQVDISRKYIGLRYYFNSASWNTSGCKNLYKSAFGNSKANKSKIMIDSNKTLYVEWQHIK